jgi:hypothetical protein
MLSAESRTGGHRQGPKNKTKVLDLRPRQAEPERLLALTQDAPVEGLQPVMQLARVEELPGDGGEAPLEHPPVVALRPWAGGRLEGAPKGRHAELAVAQREGRADKPDALLGEQQLGVHLGSRSRGSFQFQFVSTRLPRHVLLLPLLLFILLLSVLVSFPFVSPILCSFLLLLLYCSSAPFSEQSGPALRLLAGADVGMLRQAHKAFFPGLHIR